MWPRRLEILNMRFLFVAPRLHPNYSDSLRALASIHHLDILVATEGVNERHCGLKINRFPDGLSARMLLAVSSLRGLSDAAYRISHPSLFWLIRFIREREIDVIYSRNDNWYFFRTAQAAAWLTRCQFITYYQKILDPDASFDRHAIFPLAVVHPSPDMKDDPPPNFIPLAIDLTRDFGTETCTHYDPDGDQPLRLMHVGKLIERKGQEVIFRAIAALVAKGMRVEVSMYSHHPRNEYRDRLEALGEELGITSNLKFMPALAPADLLKEYRKHHVFVYSGYESSPKRDPDSATYARANGKCGTRLYSLIEAMAAGLPVICATDHHVVGAVENGANGLLFEKGDPADLAEKIQQISRMDLPAMGARSRALIEAHYNAKDFPARFERLLAQFAS